MQNESSNLDHLVHLKWLDLSFNNIKAITGLDKLTELMDLSLYNNQVKRREETERIARARADQSSSTPGIPPAFRSYMDCASVVPLLFGRE